MSSILLHAKWQGCSEVFDILFITIFLGMLSKESSNAKFKYLSFLPGSPREHKHVHRFIYEQGIEEANLNPIICCLF